MQVVYCLWDSVFPEKELPMTLLSRVLEAIAAGSDCSVGANGALFTLYHGNLYLTNPDEDNLFYNFNAEFNPEISQILELPGCMRFRLSLCTAGRLISLPVHGSIIVSGKDSHQVRQGR